MAFSNLLTSPPLSPTSKSSPGQHPSLLVQLITCRIYLCICLVFRCPVFMLCQITIYISKDTCIFDIAFIFRIWSGPLFIVDSGDENSKPFISTCLKVLESDNTLKGFACGVKCPSNINLWICTCIYHGNYTCFFKFLSSTTGNTLYIWFKMLQLHVLRMCFGGVQFFFCSLWLD